MSKDPLKKCDELIARLRELKKGLDEQTYTPVQRAAIAEANRIKNPASNAALLKKARETVERAQAQQLANMLAKNNILGGARVPKQPTDEEMFGHLVPSKEMVKNAEAAWGNTMNNWLTEATKPLNAKFKSQAEEDAYWANLKVGDRDDGQSGY